MDRRTKEEASRPAYRHSRFLALLVLLSFWAPAVPSGCGDDERRGPAFPDDVVRRLDAAVSERMRENDLPGAVVGAWVPGEGEYVVARGKANLETGEERDLEDPFRVGSITKTFVATAVLQLVDEGEVSKSDRLSRWYPEFPNAEEITIEHLLTMRSGIVDPSERIDRFASPRDAIEASARAGGAFLTPGVRTEYANINYVILGEIVAKVSGEGTGDRIDEAILEPLDLKDTTYPTGGDLPGDLRGYAPDLSTGKLEVATAFNAGPVGGAGAMVSDVSDLRVWAEAVCPGKLLDGQTQRARLRTRHLSGEPDFVGYGEGIAQVGGFCGHDGAVPGFSTEMWYLPEEDATVVVNVNLSSNDEFDPPPSAALVEAVVGILFPDDVERQ